MAGSPSPPSAFARWRPGRLPTPAGDTEHQSNCIWYSPQECVSGNLNPGDPDGGSNTIAALSRSGSERWRYATAGKTIFSPTVGPDGTVYQGSWDRNLYALRPNGSLKWMFPTQGAVSYPTTLDEKGRTIYQGDGDAHGGESPYLYALSRSGQQKWRYDTGQIRVGSPAIGLDGKVYAPASPTLFALKPSGALAWRLPGSSCPPPPPPGGDGGQPPPPGPAATASAACDYSAGIITPAVGEDGTLYTGNSSGELSAIDPRKRTAKWTFQVPGSGDLGLLSWPVVDANGTVYVGSVNGSMYAVTSKGRRKWTFSTGASITESSPAMGADGTLYFTSHDGYLYALRSK